MKRWKWVLAAVGVPAIAIAVLWVDSCYRAVAAIRAEDRRLADDIAAFRARLKPSPGAVHFKSRYQLDHGHSARRPLLFPDEAFRLLGGDFQILRLPETFSGLSTAKAVDALAATEEGLQEGGFLKVDQGRYWQGILLELLRRRISPPGLRAEELLRLAEQMDRMLASRLSFAQILDAQLLLERAEVLRVIHLREDPGHFIRKPPGWKDWFSWRIHIVNCLKELDDRHRFLRGEEGEPMRNWFHGIDLKVPELEETCSDFQEASGALRSESETIANWRFTRAALALAIFRAEHGALPKSLDELVPSLLPGIPLHPFDDSPLTYENGILKLQNSFHDGWTEWPVENR